MKRKRICVEDSAYSLLLYFLISSKKEIENTFYFVSSGIPEEVRNNLPGKYHYFDKKWFNSLHRMSWKILYLIYLRFFSRIRWPFLLNCDIFGLDHAYFSSSIVGYNKMVVIEDGTINYNPPLRNKSRHPLLSSFFWGPIYSSQKFGSTPCCKKLILTGLMESEYTKQMHPQIVSVEKLWAEASEEKRKLIFDIFNLTQEDIEKLKNKRYILFTQCLSEDKMMSEEEKVDIYRKMLKDVNPEEVVIKSHPREVTDYTKYFPQSYIFEKKIPMQLINLTGIRFNKVFTVCSTAALDFPYDIDIEFLGSEINPKIVEGYGVIRLNDYIKNRH